MSQVLIPRGGHLGSSRDVAPGPAGPVHVDRAHVDRARAPAPEVSLPGPPAAGGASGITREVARSRILRTEVDTSKPHDAQLIVAGTGIGGGPLCRLAERGFQVKFLEAGPPLRDWFNDVPLLHGRSSDNTFEVDGYSPPMALLQYFVDHYEQQINNSDVKLHDELGGVLYPRGQGVGGSGNVNANVAVAPDYTTLNALYHQSGRDPRLHPDNLRKFFARAQDPGPIYRFMEAVGAAMMAGKKLDLSPGDVDEAGWQKITRADPRLAMGDKQLIKIVAHIFKYTNNPANVKLSDIVVRAMTLFDSNNLANHGREGFTNMPISVRADGRRSSVADRLKAVLATRPDTMSIECETKVHSLIFNDRGNRVEGMRILEPHPDVLAQRQVIYALHVKTPAVPADRIEAHNAALAAEVEKLRALEESREPAMRVVRSSNGYVLSAGAFEDPMILIRSGYGPKAVLDRLGIPPAGGVYHEAVGANLKDRREITMLYHTRDAFSLIEGLGLGKNPHSDEAMKVWERSGRGAYSTNGVVASYQFKSDPSQPDPDIFAFFVPVPFRGYVKGYSADGEKYPQTFSAVLLDKNGKLLSDDSRLMTPDEFEALRARLGTVEPDPADPTMMKAKVNFNYQRPKPGETPPLYSAMLRMQDIFKGLDILTEFVPGNPFKDAPKGSLGAALEHLRTAELFPTYDASDVRSQMDWFQRMEVPLFDARGKEHKLSVERDGGRAVLSIDGQPATAAAFGGLRFFGGLAVTAENLLAQLEREYLIEYQFSQQWGHHANGTTSLGPDPKENVVGSDYRVHGIENLWVVSASATPAGVNPGPFIQLYIAGAIGEAGAEAIGEQLVANERHLGKLSPIGARIPSEVDKRSSFGENLLVTIDRARGHVGDRQGVLTGEALTALIATHKKEGFSKEDVALAEAVVERAERRKDKNAGVLRTLAEELRRLRSDQGFMLDVRARAREAIRRDGLSNPEVLRVLDDVAAHDDRRPPPEVR